jgi:hypothetical protein
MDGVVLCHFFIVHHLTRCDSLVLSLDRQYVSSFGSFFTQQTFSMQTGQSSDVNIWNLRVLVTDTRATYWAPSSSKTEVCWFLVFFLEHIQKSTELHPNFIGIMFPLRQF